MLQLACAIGAAELYLKDLLNLFTDLLDPTPEEFTLFNLEYGVDYIIKPNGEK